jgi:glucose-6-phosphate isomerase
MVETALWRIEGKDKKGLLPDSATFTTDLHSLGQFIQDGSPVFFETTLHLSHHRHDVKVPHDDQDLDGLNYLEGRSLGNIQDRAFEGTLAAHVEVGQEQQRRPRTRDGWMPIIWAISSISSNAPARCRLTQ